VLLLAREAFARATVPEIKAESCYMLARVLHAQVRFACDEECDSSTLLVVQDYSHKHGCWFVDGATML
jgi:hypothetical protein